MFSNTIDNARIPTISTLSPRKPVQASEAQSRVIDTAHPSPALNRDPRGFSVSLLDEEDCEDRPRKRKEAVMLQSDNASNEPGKPMRGINTKAERSAPVIAPAVFHA
ncbi:MAG: hypothetical protein HYR88_07185 [Verrucomicrobia bacterium]|nr:hypothetical protein [Verrucomicrobiota bacterium]